MAVASIGDGRPNGRGAGDSWQQAKAALAALKMVDTIIKDIHRTRQRMAEKFGGDIAAILEDARKRQEASGRTVWQGPSANKATLPSGAPPVNN